MAYTDIDDPTAYFQTKLYTGTNNELVLTFDGNSDLQPNMIWTKNRGRAANHVLSDTVRTIGKGLYPDTTGAEGDTNYISAIGSNGYTIVATDSVEINRDDDTFVSWNWKESADAGFDIVSYTGNATGGRTVAHNLGAVPAMMIVKNRAASVKWAVYHHKNTAAPETDHLQLNAATATSDDDSTWNDTAPTSSVFSLGGSTSTNGDGTAYIAYLFAEKKGYSKFGTYKGNGNVSGPMIVTGFSVGWIMIKKTDGSENWKIWDNKRPGFNDLNFQMNVNNNEAESNSSNNRLDLLSNGFKMRGSGDTFNSSGGNYIFMAFADQPLVSSTGVPATAR